MQPIVRKHKGGRGSSWRRKEEGSESSPSGADSSFSQSFESCSTPASNKRSWYRNERGSDDAQGYEGAISAPSAGPICRKERKGREGRKGQLELNSFFLRAQRRGKAYPKGRFCGCFESVRGQRLAGLMKREDIQDGFERSEGHGDG